METEHPEKLLRNFSIKMNSNRKIGGIQLKFLQHQTETSRIILENNIKEPFPKFPTNVQAERETH